MVVLQWCVPVCGPTLGVSRYCRSAHFNAFRGAPCERPSTYVVVIGAHLRKLRIPNANARAPVISPRARVCFRVSCRVSMCAYERPLFVPAAAQPCWHTVSCFAASYTVCRQVAYSAAAELWVRGGPSPCWCAVYLLVYLSLWGVPVVPVHAVGSRMPTGASCVTKHYQRAAALYFLLPLINNEHPGLPSAHMGAAMCRLCM